MTPIASDKPMVVLGAAGAIGGLVCRIVDGTHCLLFDLNGDRDRGIVAAAATDAIVADAVAGASVVVFCLPENAARDAIRALSKHLSPNHLLVDTLSSKSGFLALCRALELDCQHVSINPMFAPDLDPAGRPVASIVVAPGDRATALMDRLASSGVQLVSLADTTGVEHDRITAAVQVATHASVLSFGLTLASLGYQASDVQALWTPPHQTLLALLARVGTLSPEVYRDIQHEHPLAESVRLAARNALADIGSAETPEAFATLVKRALEPLGDSQDALARLSAEIFARETR